MGYFFLYKSFVYADDSLRPAVTGKMDPISFALDGDTADIVPPPSRPYSQTSPSVILSDQKDKKKAENLLEDMIKSKKTQNISVKNEPKVAPKKIETGPKKTNLPMIWLPWSEKPSNEIKIEAKKEMDRIEIEQAKKKEKKEDKPFWFWPGNNYETQKISDGEALYKVAVSDKKVSLKEAVEIGLANNIGLQSLKKREEAAQAKLNEAKRALLPTVQLQAEVNGGKSPRFYKGENQKINVSQPLFYGGELQATVKQAEANLKSIAAEYEKSKGESVHQVRTAYYGVIRAEYNSRYQAELYDKVSNIHKRSKEVYRQKLMAEVDFLNLESQYQQVFFQVESTKNDLLSAALLLRQSMGLDSDTDLPIDLKIHFKKTKPEFNKILSMAVQNNADLRSREATLEAAKYGVKIYQAKKLPRVDLRGSYGMLGETFHDTDAFLEEKADNDLEKEWFLGVEANMPLGASSIDYSQVKHVYGPTIFSATRGSEDWRHHVAFNLWDKLSNITDEKSAQAGLLQAQSEYEKAKNDLTIKIRDDFYTLQKSSIQIDSSVARIKYQEKQNLILEYMSGLQEASLSSLIDGLISQAQDRFSFIQAVADYELAKSSLSISIGDPDYFEDKSEQS